MLVGTSHGVIVGWFDVTEGDDVRCWSWLDGCHRVHRSYRGCHRFVGVISGGPGEGVTWLLKKGVIVFVAYLFHSTFIDENICTNTVVMFHSCYVPSVQSALKSETDFDHITSPSTTTTERTPLDMPGGGP